MVVGLARFDLRIPGSRSLKDKRAVLRSLTVTLRQKFNCAVAETGYHDTWQRAAVAVSVIADTQFHVRKVIGEIERRVQTHPGAELITREIDLFSPE